MGVSIDEVAKFLASSSQVREAGIPIGYGTKIEGFEVRRVRERSLVVMACGGNGVDSSKQTLMLSSTEMITSGWRFFHLTPDNFLRCMAYFSARKLAPLTWVYQHDQFSLPDCSAPGYQEWVSSCLVYASMHSECRCVAMRELRRSEDVSGFISLPSVRLHDHFFWLSYEEAGDIFSGADQILRDWERFPSCSLLGDWESRDPFLVRMVSDAPLISEARECIDLVKELLEKSVDVRLRRGEDHLLCWDAAWYQLKDLWREHFNSEFRHLKKTWLSLRDRLAPGVFDFGWLRKFESDKDLR